jgi:aminoglycoside/choline kinase family phosphotransferase
VTDDTEREDLKRAFLAEAGLAEAARTRLAADASTRRYERLTLPGGKTLVLMDSPPAADTEPLGPDATPEERIAAGYTALARLSASRVGAFAAIAGWLREQGFSAPEVTALDATHGLAVLEDLGEDMFVRRLEAGADPQLLYGAAVDLLADLHGRPAPEVVSGAGETWALSCYDGLALQTGRDLFLEWWPGLSGAPAHDAEIRAEWAEAWQAITDRGDRASRWGVGVFTHRDYHAENLLWLDDRKGLRQVGLLDFQDAVIADPAWDLLSLLQDARRDVPAELEQAMIDRYLSARPGLDRAAFLEAYAGLAALNAARILGLFARLVIRDGKSKYRAFLPRMKAMLGRNLPAPALQPVRQWLARHAPEVLV